MKKFDEIKKNIDCNWKKLLDSNPEINRRQDGKEITTKQVKCACPKRKNVVPNGLKAQCDISKKTENGKKKMKLDLPKLQEVHSEISKKQGNDRTTARKKGRLDVLIPPKNIKEKDNQEIWFDDVDEIYLERKPPSLDPTTSSSENPLVKSGSFDGLTRVVAMDCEMVGIGDDGEDSILARVSIVNHFGMCVYDKFVKPTEEVTDYRTAVSGIRPSDIKNGEDFKIVQKEVSDILRNRILVGHAIQNDLKVLFLDHPRKNIRDTSKYKPFRKLFNGRNPSLKALSEQLLGVKVQTGEHNSVQDAQAAMRLYTMHLKRWEGELKQNKNKKLTKKVVQK